MWVAYWYGTGRQFHFLKQCGLRPWSFCGAMNPEEQTVTWLISLGVLSSPKKNIADPEEFLKTSLKDGVVLCKLSERLIPGFTPKVSYWFKRPRVNKCQTVRRRWKEGRGLVKVIPTRTSPCSRPYGFVDRWTRTVKFEQPSVTTVCDACRIKHKATVWGSFQTGEFPLWFPVKRQKCSAFLRRVSRCEHPAKTGQIL